MAELAHGSQPEFWRPPSPVLTEDAIIPEPLPKMAESCARCGTEFLLGARFCHTCGSKRAEGLSPDAHADAVVFDRLWQKAVDRTHSLVARVPWSSFSWKRLKLPAWPSQLHFDQIKALTGLSTGSLIAFVLGLGCVTGALSVGLWTAKNMAEWQAIQYYRAEWLLAATAAFVAGILLKKQSPSDRE